ncbi:hypothetical protein HDU67_005209 [Dinochytrium kinnereticum]|nr:hypothetical protein HDU67_005209 [Dinochytrium kinnereticum]
MGDWDRPTYTKGRYGPPSASSGSASGSGGQRREEERDSRKETTASSSDASIIRQFGRREPQGESYTGGRYGKGTSRSSGDGGNGGRSIDSVRSQSDFDSRAHLSSRDSLARIGSSNDLVRSLSDFDSRAHLSSRTSSVGTRDQPQSCFLSIQDVGASFVHSGPIAMLKSAEGQRFEEYDSHLVSKSSMQPRRRDRFGSLGRPMAVVTNFYQLAFNDQRKKFFHYDVDIHPEAPPRKNRLVMKQLQIDLGRGNPINYAVFDGRKNLYSAMQLVEDGKEVKVSIQEDGMKDEFTISIRLAQTSPNIELEDIFHFLKGAEDVEIPREALQVLDVLFKSEPADIFFSLHRTIGTSFYPQDSRARASLPHGLDAIKGWKQSIRPTYKGLLMNLDSATTCFYPEGPLVNAIATFAGRDKIDGVNPQFFLPRSHDFRRLNRYLKHVNVRATHRSTGRRNYKIHCLSQDSARRTVVDIEKDGKIVKMSVAEYFQSVLNKSLRYPDLPVVDVGALKGFGRIYIPIEFLEIKKGQRHMGKLNDQQTAKIIKITAQKPADRRNHIEDGRRSLHDSSNAKDLYSIWEVSVGSRMTEVTARVLDPPILKVLSARTSDSSLITPQNGVFDLSRTPDRFFRPAYLHTYAVAVIGRNSQMTRFPDVVEFMESLLQQCEKKGMKVERRNWRDIIVNQGGGSVYDALNSARHSAVEATKRAGGRVSSEAQIVFCVVDQKGAVVVLISLYAQPEYDEIKKASETSLNLLTQCFVSQHLKNRSKAGVALGIALKVNAKLGGVNFAAQQKVPFMSFRDDETMVIGVDMTHPGPGSAAEGARSIAAVVASMDSRFCEYRAECGYLPAGLEIVTGLGDMTRSLLHQYSDYQRDGKRFPKKIICFRDGVSEGQFGEVALQEVQSLKKCFKELGASIRLTFVAVNKRHGAKFFVKNPRDGDRSGNVPAGTVVDTGVVHPFEFDFFLNSHAGIQGTSRAAHYHVLYDENNFSPDDLQQFTYNLCYLYARATRSVSLVPATYYAHLVAARARCYRVGGFGTDTASTLSGSREGKEAVDEEFSSVLDGIKKLMYFT